MKRHHSLHPILFSIYPVLFLVSHNLGKISIIDPIVPTALNIFFTALAYMTFKIISNDNYKAGIGASFTILMFSLYGHILRVFQANGIFEQDYRPYFIIYVTIMILGCWIICRFLKNAQTITGILNIISIWLLVTPIFQSSWFLIKSTTTKYNNANPSILINSSSSELPDIYYIILDAYGREDTLDEIYSIDNQNFIEFLESNGFYVAKDSNANYLRTLLSLSATLNMAYHDEVGLISKIDNRDQKPLESATMDNKVRQILVELGYNIHTIPNGIYSTQWENTKNAAFSWWKLVDTNFFFSYINSSLLVLPAQNFLYDLQRSRINNSFHSLESIAQTTGPNFVFAHIIAPHPPFVFDAQGNAIEATKPYRITDAIGLAITSEEYIEKYSDQLKYINSRLEKTIGSILDNSSSQPIIILQSDHGPGAYFDWENLENNFCLKERASILNAYYIPGYDNSLYPQISPVNTFRFIFKEYYGLPYDLLPDKVYFSPDSNLYEITEVTDSLGCLIE